MGLRKKVLFQYTTALYYAGRTSRMCVKFSSSFIIIWFSIYIEYMSITVHLRTRLPQQLSILRPNSNLLSTIIPCQLNIIIYKNVTWHSSHRLQLLYLKYSCLLCSFIHVSLRCFLHKFQDCPLHLFSIIIYVSSMQIISKGENKKENNKNIMSFPIVL